MVVLELLQLIVAPKNNARDFQNQLLSFLKKIYSRIPISRILSFSGEDSNRQPNFPSPVKHCSFTPDLSNRPTGNSNQFTFPKAVRNSGFPLNNMFHFTVLETNKANFENPFDHLLLMTNLKKKERKRLFSIVTSFVSVTTVVFTYKRVNLETFKEF